MKNLVIRHELFAFFLLSYLLSWWLVPVMNGAMLPHGPALAAVIVIALTLGKNGLREYWKRLTNWRAGRFYLIAPLIVVGYTAVAFILNLLTGATMVETPRLLSMGVFVQLLFFGGQWEELGWTGYALPKLQQRFADHPNGWLRAALILGVFRALWHLPLFLQGKMYWFDIFVFSFAIQIIIAWVYNRSGSVPSVMLFHFVSNVLGAMTFAVFAGGERLTFYALFMSLAMLFALGLVWFAQFKTRGRNIAVI